MFDMKFDAGGFQAAVQALAGPEVRRAAAWALNDTAQDVLNVQRFRMDVTFDRPTPFTKNAFQVVRARPDTLMAAVRERGMNADRHYLKVQESGGQRPQSGFEAQMARSLAYDGVIQAILPADNARLDAFGNWSAGERNQVMSALKAQRDSAANMTDASWRKARKRRATYFVPTSGLTPGIYRKAPGGQLGIVAIFTAKAPTYTERLGFFDGAAEVWRDRLPKHLDRAVFRAMAKRFGQG